jgi:uncharacterized protein YeaO (DUF488 family)
MPVQVRRVYEPAAKSDGVRILVDRLWPRGISKDKARIDEWMKDIAPSTALRMWFGHREDRWEEFQKRYRAELGSSGGKQLLVRLKGMSRKGTVTLVFGAKDEEHNNAIVLAMILKRGI